MAHRADSVGSFHQTHTIVKHPSSAGASATAVHSTSCGRAPSQLNFLPNGHKKLQIAAKRAWQHKSLLSIDPLRSVPMSSHSNNVRGVGSHACQAQIEIRPHK